MGEEPFELMNSVAEVNDKCFYLARTGEDGVNQQCKEVQEIISQKVTEGQTHNQFSDGLDMFERDNLVSDLVFDKRCDCLCQWLTAQ